MSISMKHRTLALFALAVVSTAANAQLECDELEFGGEFDGRCYEVVAADRISWPDAKANAEGRTHHGVQGHLATINSPEEHAFVDSLNVPPGNRLEAWIGGFQDDGPEPGGSWKSTNGEVIPGVTTAFPYANWQVGEPDNARGKEDHLAIGQDGLFGFSDEDGDSNQKIWGYVVEYGDKLVPFPVSDCAFDVPGLGCPVVKQNGEAIVSLKLPKSAQFDAGDPNDPTDGDLYTVRTWLVDDIPGRCGPGAGDPLPLDLLPETAGPEVTVSGDMCAHPGNGKILVVKTESAVQIPSGVVEFTNDTTAQLNPAYDCNAPLSGEHPLEQDIVVFQYDDRTTMIDDTAESGVDPALDNGSVTESTNACINPSRGSGGKGTYILVGLSFQQGNAASPQERLFDEVEHKLILLREAVQRARADGGAIKNGDATKLSSAIGAALDHMRRGNLGEAVVHMQMFKATTQTAVFKTGPSGTNWNGEFLMRVDSAIFTTRVKLQLLAP